MNVLTHTIPLGTQESGMQFVALQSGREESLPSIGRGEKWKNTEKKESKKERGMFTELYRGEQKKQR